jgi:hypothetical protein
MVRASQSMVSESSLEFPIKQLRVHAIWIGKCVAPYAVRSRAGCAETGAESFIFRLFRQVIRAARIRYDQQVVFGLPHHLRMRSSPKLHVLKPWLNRFIFRLNRTLFWG